MDSTPAIIRIADALEQAGLEAILTGNAAVAIHGAPVTTIDFDFLYRVSPVSQRKLRRFAELLGGSLVKPFPALSSVFRIEVPGESLQVGLTSDVHGIASFNSLRARSTAIEIEGRSIMVAPLADIIKSKRAAGRPRDLAVLPVLEETLAQIQDSRKQAPSSRARGSERRE